MARIRKLAEWLDRDYPSAAASLLEGQQECFIINRMCVLPSLMRCLAMTNIIESPRAGVRIPTRRVTHRQNGKIVIRWLASAFIRTEKRFNQILGYCDVWILEAILNDAQPATGQVAAQYHQPNRRPPLSTRRGTSPSQTNAGDRLQEETLGDHPLSGTAYRQNGKQVTSLGVTGYWDHDLSRQDSRNRNPKSGIGM